MPDPLNPDFFRGLDDSDDELFYLAPRFVVHIFVVHIDDAGIWNVEQSTWIACLPLATKWLKRVISETMDDSEKPARDSVVAPAEWDAEAH